MASSLGESSDTEAPTAAAAAGGSGAIMSPPSMKEPPLANPEEIASSFEPIKNNENEGALDSTKKVPLNGNSVKVANTMTAEGKDTEEMVVQPAAAPGNTVPSPPVNISTDNATAASSTTVQETTTAATAASTMAVMSSSVVEEKQSSSSTPSKQITEEQLATSSNTAALLPSPSLKDKIAKTNTTSNTTKTTVNPRPKVADKSPRKENDWLRSPTSIGDGYSKIVIEIGKLRHLLVTYRNNHEDSATVIEKSIVPSDTTVATAAAAAAPSPSGNSVFGKFGNWINGSTTKSSNWKTTITAATGEDDTTNDAVQQTNHETQQHQLIEEEAQVQQRLDIIDQHAKSLMTSQRSGFLNTNYDLPQLVLTELDLIKSQLDQCCSNSNTDGVILDSERKDDDAESEDELQQAKEMYESIKSFSVELASKLDQEIQKVVENRKVKITDGQGPRSAAVDGAGEGETSSEELTLGAATAATETLSTDTPQKKKRKRVGAKCLTKVRQCAERRGVQFLSSSATATTSSSGETRMSVRNRRTYDKSLVEIAENIPEDVRSESLMDDTTNWKKKGSSYLSYEDGNIPTMAPFMRDGQPTNIPDYAAAFGKNKKRKRGLRDSSGSTTSSGGPGNASQTKSKRSRRENDSSESGTPAAGALPSSKKDSATNLHVRVLPDMTAKPKVAFVEGDANPNRLCNPLLRLPQFPDGLDPPIEEIPQGGELWNLADLHWAEPDTYPISYLARLLGFDVPEEGIDQPFAENFDPMSVKMMKDDTDPWACVPNRGSFIDHVWKNADTHEGAGRNDDLKLSYCDPLWANIINSYRGFNESDFKDAGKGFTDDLLPDCLEFALERGVLSKEKGVSFRFGNPTDVDLLQPLADKCSWKSHQKHDLATSLRGQSSFCIIAESPASGPIAFIQYSFCWYRVEEKISAASGAEKVSELVVFLDALVYDSDMGAVAEGSNLISHDDLECVKTLLTSLSLVHAARANIWYGMVDSPQSSVHFFTKYFRVSAVGKETGDDVPLVFDLKKCHFRFAILLLEETLKMKQSNNSGLNAGAASDRMVVRVPANTSELRGNFSSAGKESRSKKAHVRLVQKANEIEMFYVSANSGEKGESLTTFDPSCTDVNVPSEWDVLRLFPVDDKKSPTEGTSASPTDGFLDELEKKKKELQKLEASIEVTARGLLAKAYKETSDFHRNGTAAKRQKDEKTLEEYAEVQKRLHEADLAWQAQLDQDMDAVCDICFDGEVTPENQIIFCDTCNVAVHQGCYGIDKVPSGNYFCRACTHFEIDKAFLAAERRRGPRTKPTRPHINCELCPRRHGAFVLVDSPQLANPEPTDNPKKAKWVHVSCAKWHGMNYVDIGLKDKIEDVTVLKNWFRGAGHKCCLCDSSIGAMHQCRHEGCDEWLHLTCGRSIGTCSMTGAERKEYWADEENLKEFFGKVTSNLSGAKCVVCEIGHDPNDKNKANRFCPKCGVFSHAECADPDRGEDGVCYSCRFIEENKDSDKFVDPQCHMCSTSAVVGGPLVKTKAKPLSMKKWRDNKAAFNRSLYGPNNFCHTLCGLWNPKCESLDGGQEINCFNIVMADGRRHVTHQSRCFLCGKFEGAKVHCFDESCITPGGTKNPYFHVTCARQAGLEVSSDPDFILSCFRHAGSSFVFRARLEDFMEIEIMRYSEKVQMKNLLKISNPMSWDHASRLFHSAVDVLRTLGWAWRWAEWWVESGDNWEPLIRDDQNEEEMTDKELKKVDSTPKSRCEDARRCRLAALGAALRNRDYDKNEGDDQEPLERALMAVMSTPSLVGPLKPKEKEFYVTWFSLAYRSASPRLGFGDHKTPVVSESFCVHQSDGSPKFELGTRPLPGKTPPEKENGFFEPTVDEPDDFLQTLTSGSPVRKKRQRQSA
eukprot:scaffold4301_cov144-Skeletonema_menzelii.AAC.2